MNPLYQQNIVSISDFTREQIECVLDTAHTLEQHPAPHWLDDKIIANCFFEASTRTRLSFACAANRLGAKVIGFDTAANTSLAKKGESLNDSIKVISHYADAIVIRHPKAGSARFAAEVSSIPVINAGDGANQHPTQTLLDLFSIRKSQGRLDGLRIACVGDLKYGRTIHSLCQACALYDVRFYFVTTDQLTLPESISRYLSRQGIRFSFHRDLKEVISKVDILYMTRLQRERFEESEFREIRNRFTIHADQLTEAKENLKILHPLPRQQELHPSVDDTPFAYYFQQAGHGVPVREALISLVLREALPQEVNV